MRVITRHVGQGVYNYDVLSCYWNRYSLCVGTVEVQ